MKRLFLTVMLVAVTLATCSCPASAEPVDLDAAPSESNSEASNTIPLTSRQKTAFSFAGTKNVVFLVDCSLSMKDKANHEETKMDIARKSLAKALTILPTEIGWSIRVFGRNPVVPGSECQDTELMVALKNHSIHERKEITRQILDELKPAGMTPLTYSFSRIFEKDLNGVVGRTVVIFFGDGDDTCGYDTKAYFRSFVHRDGPKPNVVVIGLSDRRAVTKTLQTLSRISAGNYYTGDQLDSFFEDLKILKKSK